MRTYLQLAESAYKAYYKEAGGKSIYGRPLPEFWELGEAVTACWCAAAKAVAAEIAAIL